MVSFFGIKFRGERKKSQKAQDKEQLQHQKKKQTRHEQQEESRFDHHPTLSKGQYFGHNFSRPSLAAPPSLRPGTACAGTTSAGARSWRAVFGTPAASSSMTDLEPRTGGMLRHHASEHNLRSCRAARNSTVVAMPEWLDPLQAHGVRPDVTTAPRPGTAPGIKSGGSDAAAAPKSALSGGSPTTASSVSSMAVPAPAPALKASLSGRLPSFAKLDLDMDALLDAPLAAPKAKVKADSVAGAGGCPSPPQSDGTSERSYFAYHPSIGRVSPDSRPPSSRCNGPSALRNVDTAAIGACPPSPAPSPPRTRDGPDALVPGLQRRQTLRVDPDERATSRKTQHIEGFIGNFADFDFGVSVSRPSDGGGGSGDGARSKVDRWLGEADAAHKPLPSCASAPSLLSLRPTPTLASFPQPPSTICEEPEPASSVGTPSPRAFPARKDSKLGLSRQAAPHPLRSMPPLPVAAAVEAKSGPPSPYGPAAEGEGNYVARAEPPKVPAPVADESPKSKSKGGLPRGRVLEPPAAASDDGEVKSDDDESDESSHILDDDDYDDRDSGPILPAWSFFDQGPHRQSAVPPPLSTSIRSPATSTTSSAPSGRAPRLPSQIFPGLTASISGSSLDLTRSFELALAESLADGFGSPLARMPSPESGVATSPVRVLATRAPPRPEMPMTLPPSLSERGGLAMRSHSEGTVGAAFI